MAPIYLTSFEGATWGTEVGSLEPLPWPVINFEAVTWVWKAMGMLATPLAALIDIPGWCCLFVFFSSKCQ